MLGLIFIGPIALGLPVGLLVGSVGGIELIGVTLAACAAVEAVLRIGMRVADYRDGKSKNARTRSISRAA